MGKDSISLKIDEPVVVNPDTDSKKALINKGIDPDIIYGRQPNKLIISHESVTVRNASFLPILYLSLLSLVKKNNKKPEISDIKDENIKGESGSL